MTETIVTKGPGLARGPALIVGALLTAFGLLLLLKNGDTPNNHFPDGTVNGPKFLGFETNGWTAFFTITAGALLLFGAAQHLLAKTMSLLVGLALGACAVIALVDGNDVLGLAAANGIDALGWGIAAAVLLVNSLLPRIRHKEDDTTREVRPVASSPVRREAVVEPPPAPRPEPVAMRPVDSTPVPGTRRVVGEPEPRTVVETDRRPGGLIDPERRTDGSVDLGYDARPGS